MACCVSVADGEAGEMDVIEQSPHIRAWHRSHPSQERERQWIVGVMRYVIIQNCTLCTLVQGSFVLTTSNGVQYCCIRHAQRLSVLLAFVHTAVRALVANAGTKRILKHLFDFDERLQ